MATDETHPDAHEPSTGVAAEPRSGEDLHAADAHHVGGGHEHEHMVGGHAHEDDHSADHGDASLGPVDWGAWLISAVGVGAGLMVAVMLFVSIQHG
jgi:hypothetical protein